MIVHMDPARVGIAVLLAFVVLVAALLLAWDALRPQRVPRVPRGTTVRRNLAYVTGGHARQKLDVYVPKGARNPPLVILVHGGSFVEGDKRDEDAAAFVTLGYAVASINYRYASDAAFPAQIEDCKAAVRWLRANAASYGYDPERFGARGSSAGGFLVTLLGVTGATSTYDVGANLDVSARVQAVADRYGPIEYSGVNVLRYVSKDCPPFIIVHGDRDPLVPYDQSELLVAALERAGVVVTLYTVKGGGHGGFDDPNAEALVREFFATHLGPPGS
jgi:acetyl esterase/lipase